MPCPESAFHSSLPHPLTLKFFLTPLLWRSLSLGVGTISMSPFGRLLLDPLIFVSLTSCCPLQKEASLAKAEENHVYKQMKCLGSIFMTRPFSRTAVAVSLLGPVTPQATGFQSGLQL